MAERTYVIRGGTVVDHTGSREADVAVRNGVVRQVSENRSLGYAVRALCAGSWGFAGSDRFTDRDLDAKVERTRSRPIPAGQISAKQALAFLVAQALIGLVVLLQFNRFAIATGIASLLIVAIYPFMKRITWWPQAVLGLAFSWGALMGFAVAFARLDATAFLLYAGSISWVIGYDTIYAHQDIEDDALIGIKSTARLFGARTHRALVILYTLAVVLIAAAMASAGVHAVGWIGLAAFAAHLGWQIRRLEISDTALCKRVFYSNRDAGLLLFAGLVADAVLRSVG